MLAEKTQDYISVLLVIVLVMIPELSVVSTV